MQAALTMYIFYFLLDLLPYIGSGIVGEQDFLGENGSVAKKVKQIISSMGGGK